MPKQEQQQPPLNESVDNSNVAMYVNAFAAFVNGNEAVLDFRQTTPRSDTPQGTGVMTLVTKHETIIMPTYVSKMLLIILKEQIDGVEKQFGEIKLPPEWRPTKSKDGAAHGTASYIR